MTIDTKDWSIISGTAGALYHRWEAAPVVIGRLSAFARDYENNTLLYYLIDCGEYDLKIYPYITLKCLDHLDTGTIVKIRYYGMQPTRQGKRTYASFTVATTATDVSSLFGLYDPDNVRITDVSKVMREATDVAGEGVSFSRPKEGV